MNNKNISAKYILQEERVRWVQTALNLITCAIEREGLDRFPYPDSLGQMKRNEINSNAPKATEYMLQSKGLIWVTFALTLITYTTERQGVERITYVWAG